MNTQRISILFASSLDRFEERNPSFDSGVLRVAYTNANRNGSFISKETFERCITSIYNCPIVCNYDRETDTIGAHDMELVRDDEGGMRIVNVTTPVGVVPESANYFWENVEEDDGSIHEYLCVEVLLWKRQEAYKKIKDDGVVAESMEIAVKNGSMQDGLFVIDDFNFTAFCLLGTAEPCYESASLHVFSRDEFKTQLEEMMQDFKASFSLVQASQEDYIGTQNYSEGGKSILNEKIALMTQYGLTEDMLDFKLEDFTEDELVEKFEAIVECNKAENFALAEQFRSELIEALGSETIETCFGTTGRYWYTDHDGEAMEVYCYDYEDWKLYGFAFAMNGDKVNVDFASKKRKKFSIVDFDEGEQTSAFAAVYSMISGQHEEIVKSWSEKFDAASGELATLKPEVEALRKFKLETEEGADAQAREDVLSRFEDLAGIEAFDALCEDCLQYTLEDLEEKCFAIRGRTQVGKFSLSEPKAPKLPVEKTDPPAKNEPYGGVFTEYGIAGRN